MNDNDPLGTPATGMPDTTTPAHPGASIIEPVPPVPAEPVSSEAAGAPGDARESAEADASAPPPPVEPPTPGPTGGAPDPVRTQNRVALVGTVALVVALVAGGAFLLGRGTGPGGAATASPGSALTPATPGAGASAEPGASTAVPTALPSSGPDLPSEGNRLGLADAKVVVEYWADYQCPYCAKFAQEVIPQLIPRIEDGTVALVHRDYAFIGPESIDAAVAVSCAGREGKYWAMHDAVYAAQNGENEGAFARPRLNAIAASAGLDGAAIEACLDDHDAFVGVLADTAEAVRIGIESTPTAIVNGKRFLGVPDMGELNAAIEAAIAGASPAPQPSPAASTNPWSGTPTDGLVAGDPAAPVTVDLWMDYQAKDSAAVANELGPELRTRMAAGTVQAKLHDLALLGDESVVAATALRCVADQDGPAWFVSDILSVSAQGPGAGIYTPQNLLRFVAQLGLDVRAFDACVADAAVAQAVRDETAAGKADGMAAGPVIIVSAGGSETDRFTGPPDVAKVLAAIDAAAPR
ncbi:MAG TPA: thioredoxin domain-containing protein [Candidatus Limnocylindrales bacterium]|nr:thioredoxin domain-containing protein [Candidatus Limnocylindrales bacterium]